MYMHSKRVRNERTLIDILDPNGRDYHLLPTTWLLALAGRPYNHQTRTATLGKMTEEGKLKRKFLWFKHRLYHHPDRQISENLQKHQFMEDLVQASIELGARADGFEFTCWQDILPFIPERPDQKYPRRIYLDDKRFVVPDGYPFRISKGDKQLYILGKEIDRDTEGGNVNSTYANSIRRKVKEYKELFGGKLYHKHYGFKNSVVLFVTTSERRQNAILQIIKEEFKEKPCTYLWVTHTPDWWNEPRFPEPPLDFFTRPYKRYNAPDAYLNAL